MMPMTTTERGAVATLLDRSLELLERDGWQQGDFGARYAADRSPRCILGLLCSAMDYIADAGVKRVAHARAARMIRAAAEPPIRSDMVLWNDQRDRTIDDVRAALTGARNALDTPHP